MVHVFKNVNGNKFGKSFIMSKFISSRRLLLIYQINGIEFMAKNWGHEVDPIEIVNLGSDKSINVK
jgi:hypothetical protein